MGNTKYNFQTLTPIPNMDLKIYADSINFAMTTSAIKNIAISGPYGAGKSSLIETYKAKNEGATFLHISLAHFNPAEGSVVSDAENVNNTQLTNSVIEGKIINQLIHQATPSKIPQTDFKIKRNLPGKVQKGLCAASVCVIIALLHMILFGTWSNLVNSLSIPFLKTILLWSAHYDSLFLSGGLCLAALSYGVLNLIKTQKHRKLLKKISFQGNDIEIFSEETNSYFDKYLNETLYLFENCGFDNIVFEDMDRYNSNHIFEKLREMNTLINNRKPSGAKPLRFFYLLRDDIFDSKDRTKFFDYIIPVVPVIDGSNSINKFLEVFREAKIENEFTESFLNDLSLYIDDMRILKNICNEYIIYLEQISKDIDLEKDNLLAILVYKNLFPRDFSALQLRKGYVYNLFEQRYSLCGVQMENLEKKIEEIDKLLISAKKETLEHINELDALFLLPSNAIITNKDGTVSLDSTRLELAQLVKNRQHGALYSTNQTARYTSAVEFDVETEIKKLEANPIYMARKQAIEAKESEKCKTLTTELQLYKRQLREIQNQRLKDVIPFVVDEQDVFGISYANPYVAESKNTFDDIKNSNYFDLIVYLVRNGYIDESYSDYMTYFYKESITANDKNFLLSVTNRKKKEHTYSLNDASRILSRLQPISFSYVEVLNLDLIDMLLIEARIYPEHIAILFKQLEETENFDYIAFHWENCKKERLKERFIEALNNHWPNIFDRIIAKSTMSDKQKRNYVLDSFYYSHIDEIVKMNSSGVLSEYISSNPNFLNISEPRIPAIIDRFTTLNIKFISLDYETSNEALFREVYEEKMYIFNMENVLLMLRNIYGVSGTDTELVQKSFSLVFGKTDEPLAKYVEENIETHLAMVLALCEKQIMDNEDIAIKIINHSAIKELENKMTYIRYLMTPITDINKVTVKHLWPALLDAQIVKHSDKNILSYYFHSDNKLDIALTNFINKEMPAPLDFNRKTIASVYGAEKDVEFALEIIGCNEIKNEQYKAVISAIGISLSTFDVSDINLDKISILIDLNVIPMAEAELFFMRETYKGELIHYIVQNINAYMDVVDDSFFGVDELAEILELLLTPISDAYKLKLLEFTTEEISIQGKNYSSEIVEYILNNNYDSDDFGYLVANYGPFKKSTKDIIDAKCLENIAEIIAVARVLDSRLYNTLINDTQINVDNKIELLAIQISSLSVDETKKSLRAMSLDDYCGLFDRKQTVVDYNARSQRLLEIFAKHDWAFTSDEQDDGTIRIYGKSISS